MQGSRHALTDTVSLPHVAQGSNASLVRVARRPLLMHFNVFVMNQ
jgi:hypothetical protein